MAKQPAPDRWQQYNLTPKDPLQRIALTMRRPLLIVCLLLAIGCAEQQSATTVTPLPVIESKTKSALGIGDDFPILNAIDFDGNPIVFDDSMLGSRYTLVVFWSTWCGFCMHELPHEIELSHRYTNKGLRVIGINADESLKAGRDAALENSIPWLNLYEGKERQISEKLGINAWPALFLLDSDGTVVAKTPDLRSRSLIVLDDGESRTELALDRKLEDLLGK